MDREGLFRIAEMLAIYTSWRCVAGGSGEARSKASESSEVALVAEASPNSLASPVALVALAALALHMKGIQKALQPLFTSSPESKWIQWRYASKHDEEFIALVRIIIIDKMMRIANVAL
jgi:hypothetical protein